MMAPRRRWVAASFDRAASAYDEHAILQKTVLERLLERLDLVRLKPGLILDLGSGTGTGAKGLARRYRQATIIQMDLSPVMLDLAKQSAPRFFSRHRFVRADLNQIPLDSASIDMVFSSLTLQWTQDPLTAFSEIHRVLKADGLLLFSTLGPDTLIELRQSWQEVDDDQHVNAFVDMHDLGDGLVSAGLEDVVMDVETITLQYSDCLQLMRDLKVVGANSVMSGRHDGLTGKGKLHAMMDAYERYRKNDLLPATYEVIYGHARKPLQHTVRTVSGETRVSVDSLRKNLQQR